jgi:hypothetical protein
MIYNTKVVIDIESGEVLFRDLPHIYSGSIELCDKKAKAKASQAADTAKNEGSRYGAQASDVASTLVPEYRKEATSPTGFMPQDVNAMLVAGEQGAGGAASSLAGEAGLGAARSRNSGALAGTLAEIARSKGRQLSQNALNVQTMNAEEKQRQRSEGLRGLSSVYGTDVGAELKEQGLVPEDINAMLKANESGWGKNLMGWANTLTNAASAGKMIHG